MGSSTTLKKVKIISDKKVNANNSNSAKSSQGYINCRAIDNLIAEGGSNFVRYLGSQDLLNDTGILLLSPKHHYYFDHNELKCTSTLIVLKKLNLIENIDNFLYDLHKSLSPGASLIGYFSDSSRLGKSKVISIIYKKIINYMDSRIDMGFDSQRVANLLESYGYQVADMTMIRGLIYFRARTV